MQTFISEKNNWFISAFEEGMDALEICRVHSEMIDKALHALFAEGMKKAEVSEPIALLALGGYGRREMGLYSDIDLLFLHDSSPEKALRCVTDGILYPFWNSQIEAGGATRTIEECRLIMQKDVKALTAMMDARLICGDPSLFNSLQGTINEHFSSSVLRRKFIESKLLEQDERLKRFGDSIYLLQPNVKEGEGGLRDYHTLVWTARAAFNDLNLEEAVLRAMENTISRIETDCAVKFIWRIRHALHIVSGRRVDRLSETDQESVARRLGFSDESGSSAAESLMSLYYQHAQSLHVNCRRALEKIKREIVPQKRLSRLLHRRRIGENFIRSRFDTLCVRSEGVHLSPQVCLDAFAKAKRLGISVDAETKEEIIKKLKPIDDYARSDSAVAALWREIFSSFDGLDRILSDLQECGLLLAFFPEMHEIIHRVQHDGLHSYTVGVHSIRTVGELKELTEKKRCKTFPLQASTIESLDRPWVLAVAAFFHDIGKGRGGNHAIVGGKIVETIAKRLHFGPVEVGDISFLVSSHLLMAKLAFHRDVRDQALIGRFAEGMRSPEMLKMLYLLTFADMRAMGPGSFSDWKGSLLSELYLTTLEKLEKGIPGPDRAKKEEMKRINAVLGFVGRDCTARDVRLFVSSLPERYLFSTDPETVAAHMVMMRSIAMESVATSERMLKDRGCTEFSVVTRDRPGLFAKITGILTAGGANISGAEIYTSADGFAIDVLWITDAAGGPFGDPAQRQAIHDDLRALITGLGDVDRLVGAKFERRFLFWASRHRPPEIWIDNDVSAFETVIEISADDRRGLLYTIASTLHGLGIQIDRARITTLVDRVTDVFYIRDKEGKKIVLKERLDNLRTSLLNAVDI